MVHINELTDIMLISLLKTHLLYLLHYTIRKNPGARRCISHSIEFYIEACYTNLNTSYC